MYFFLEQEFGNEKTLMKIVGSMYYNNAKFKDHIFDSGEKIDEMKFKKPFQIIVNEKVSSYKKKKLTDKLLLSVVNVGPVLLISKKLMELLKKSKIENVQFFDVEIKASDFELNDYKLLNIIGKIDCIDKKKSKLKFMSDGDILSFEKLVLDEAKIPKDLKLFFLGEIAATFILIDEELKNTFISEGISGVEYDRLDQKR
jgi:hypothetical protein